VLKGRREADLVDPEPTCKEIASEWESSTTVPLCACDCQMTALAASDTCLRSTAPTAPCTSCGGAKLGFFGPFPDLTAPPLTMVKGTVEVLAAISTSMKPVDSCLCPPCPVFQLLSMRRCDVYSNYWMLTPRRTWKTGTLAELMVSILIDRTAIAQRARAGMIIPEAAFGGIRVASDSLLTGSLGSTAPLQCSVRRTLADFCPNYLDSS
jgi:hypothetical protein